jgi:hypothetical protein
MLVNDSPDMANEKFRKDNFYAEIVNSAVLLDFSILHFACFTTMHAHSLFCIPMLHI